MEAAVVLFFVLVPLTLGVIQYSWLFLKAQQITNAARSGARVGIVGGDIEGTVDTLMTAAHMEQSKSGYTVDYPDPNSVSPGFPVTVTVAIDATNVATNVALINAPYFLPLPPNGLSASVTMAKEGP